MKPYCDGKMNLSIGSNKTEVKSLESSKRIVTRSQTDMLNHVSIIGQFMTLTIYIIQLIRKVRADYGSANL